MTTDYWGPLCWKMLHSISYSSKKKNDIQTQKEYYNFFSSTLTKIIPCDKCKQHWIESIKKTNFRPMYCREKNSMINWLIYCHNLVNIRHNKRKFTRKEVDNIYIGKNHNQEVYRFLLYIRKMVQFKQLNQEDYNLCLMFVSKYLKISCHIS